MRYSLSHIVNYCDRSHDAITFDERSDSRALLHLRERLILDLRWHLDQIAMEAMRKHHHLTGKGILIMLIQSALDQIGINVKQIPANHFRRASPGAGLKPVIPPANRQFSICYENALH